MENRWLIKAGLAIGLVMACGYGSAETTRELRDGKYWIDVPAMCSRPKSHPVSWLSCGETHEENQR